MPKLPGKFNAADHGDMGFDAIPADDYEVKLSNVKVKDNKAKLKALKEGKDIPGTVWTFVFEVTSGQYKGRLLFTPLNLEHTSEQTVDFAHRELKAIAEAIGKTQFEDTDELLGSELLVTAKVEPSTSQQPERNKITKYKSLKGVAKPSRPGKAKSKAKPAVTFDD